MFRTPEFWYKRDVISVFKSYLLTPFTLLYLLGHYLNLKLRRPKKYKIPIISVGGVTVGGSGKTPVTIAIAKKLISMGKCVHIVTRGYGKNIQNNERVMSEDCRRFGDEAVMLSKIAPTWTGCDKDVLILQAISYGANIVIIDDGAQSFSIHCDLRFVVVDANQMLGNGKLLPAGPMREPLNWILDRSDILVEIGDSEISAVRIPVVCCNMEASLDIEDKDVFAFCAIGYPEKFFNTLLSLNKNVVGRVTYPDHHFYKSSDLDAMLMRANSLNAKLVTTEKDFIKIHKFYRPFISVVKIEISQDAFGDDIFSKIL